MANTKFRLKKSSVAGKIPDSAGMEYGELALNYHDGKLWFKDDSDELRAFNDSAATHNLIFAYVDSDYVLSRAPGVANASTIDLDNHTGDSSTTAFSLSRAPQSDRYSFVSIDGIIQSTDAYSITGQTLTMSEAPEASAAIEVRTLNMATANVYARDYLQYIYTPSTSTATYADSDDNGNILSYEIGKLQVHVNGEMLTPGTDFTADDGTDVTISGTAPTSGDTVIITSLATTVFNASRTTTSLVSTAANQTVDTFNASTYRSARYTIQMTHGTDYSAQEVMVIHDGSTAYNSSYGLVETGSSLGTVATTMQSGMVLVTVSPTYSNTTVKITKNEIGV